MAFKIFKELKVGFDLGVFKIEGNWEISEAEQKAAWELYVELATRIAVVELKSDEGILREALSSLKSIFDSTRTILVKYGPSIAIPSGNKSEITFGFIAISVLNSVIRPFLAKWHPLLTDHENKRPQNKSISENERLWSENEQFRKELNIIRLILIDYANTLGEVSGIGKKMFIERL